MKKILLVIAAFSSICLLSCKNKDVPAEENSIATIEKFHKWYAFGDKGIERVSLPQNAPKIQDKPWTEAVRISCASNGYALVNRSGILCFDKDEPVLYEDKSIFENESADGLVFDHEIPVFYLFRSTFFNERIDAKKIQDSRPVLVEFNPESKQCLPLLAYKNLELEDTDQISAFKWTGSKWICASKRASDSGIEFSYFSWQTPIPLVELNPALEKSLFTFEKITEDRFKDLNMPALFRKAPQSLKDLLKSIPQEMTFYVTLYDGSGRSPEGFYNAGNNSVPLYAYAENNVKEKYMTALFSDGTTYINDKAFRLPKLPQGFTYGQFTIKNNKMYAAWEETSFYKTSRSGFIAIDLSQLLGDSLK